MDKREREYRNNVAETLGTLSLGILAVALIAGIQWATIVLFTCSGLSAIVALLMLVAREKHQQWLIRTVTTPIRVAIFKRLGWLIVVVMVGYNLTQKGGTVLLIIGIIIVVAAYAVFYLSLPRMRDDQRTQKTALNSKAIWFCSGCNIQLDADHSGPCPSCGHTRKNCVLRENPIKRGIIRFLDRCAIRSFSQLFIHLMIAIVMAVLIFFLVNDRVIISSGDFVTIMSSSATASGVLLAVFLAFATFMSKYATDWREKLIERLFVQREKLAAQMKLSAQHHPNVARVLVPLLGVCNSYIPGQPIEQKLINDVDTELHDWINSEIQASIKKGISIDYGNINHYDIYEKHLLDANNISTDLSFTLTDLSLAERFGRSLHTHPPVVSSLAIILVISLILSLIGSVGTLCIIWHLPILVIPIYLLLLTIIALVLDFRGAIGVIRGRETGYEIAMMGFAGNLPHI